MSNEDVSDSIDRLGRGSTHGALHEPRQLEDDRLHHAQVVQHRDDAAQKDNDRHDLKIPPKNVDKKLSTTLILQNSQRTSCK